MTYIQKYKNFDYLVKIPFSWFAIESNTVHLKFIGTQLAIRCGITEQYAIKRAKNVKHLHDERTDDYLAWIGPSTVKRRRGGFYGLDRKVSVDAGLKELKVISRGEDGGREWVPVSGGHRDKRAGESARSNFIQFDSEGALSIRKPHVSSKEGFRGDSWF